jgi:hypothetical protein
MSWFRPCIVVFGLCICLHIRQYSFYDIGSLKLVVNVKGLNVKLLTPHDIKAVRCTVPLRLKLGLVWRRVVICTPQSLYSRRYVCGTS